MAWAWVMSFASDVEELSTLVWQLEEPRMPALGAVQLSTLAGDVDVEQPQPWY